jgi:hypothetical protein
MHSGRTPPGQKSPVSIGNALHWKHVDEFTLLQAACLLAGIEPLNAFEDLHVASEAGASYQMLTQAIRDGRLVAYLPSPARRTVQVPERGQHEPGMFVSREDLTELAHQIGDKPSFLFPNSEKTRQGQVQTRTYSQARLEAWYRRRVAEWSPLEPPPSRDDDLDAARANGFPTVPREAMRKLRRKYAPSEWSKKGARPRKNKLASF